MSAAAQPARRPAASAGVESSAQGAARLMQQMGSTKGYDPIPPDQYVTLQDARYPDAYTRFWAWLMAHTIRYGHRSPFAVMSDGTPAHLEHAAADLGMDISNVRKLWKQCESEKRGYRKPRDPRLFVAGNLVLPDQKGEDEANKKGLYKPFPPYIAKQIKELAPDVREKLLSDHEADTRLRNQVQAEAIASVRAIFDQRQYSRFSAAGIKIIREKQSEKKTRAPLAGFADSVLPEIERFVQTFSGSVRTPPTASYKASAGSVQTSASLLGSEATENSEKDSAAAATLCSSPGHPTTTNAKPPLEENIAELPRVLMAMRRHAFVDDAAGVKLIHDCRTAAAECTAEEIVAAVYHYGSKIGKQHRNPVGFLLTCVPAYFGGQDYRQRRAEQSAASRRDQERERNLAREILASSAPEYTAEDKAWARQVLEKV